MIFIAYPNSLKYFLQAPFFNPKPLNFMEEEKKGKDNSGLFSCGALVLGVMVITAIAIIGGLIFKGRSEARELLDNNGDDNPIKTLQGGFIVLVILVVIYLVRKRKKDG